MNVIFGQKTDRKMHGTGRMASMGKFSVHIYPLLKAFQKLLCYPESLSTLYHNTEEKQEIFVENIF